MELRAKIESWKKDRLLGRLIKNSSQLLGGSLVQSALGFFTVILAARGLGPEKYGMLVLVQTYVIIIDKLVNFQSWQALIKYGADILETDSAADFKRLIKFGTLLDAGSAVLGAAVALGGIHLVGLWWEWSPQFASMLMVYSTLILFNLSGTPTAILRLFDRFGLFAIQKVVMGLLRLGGVIVAYTVNASLWGYLAAWLVGEIVGYLLLLGLGWRELYMQGYRRIFESPLRGVTNTFNGLWNYVWTTNLNGSIRMASRRVDTVIIGGVLGPAAVGLYEVAKKFASVLNRFSSPLYQAIYPELAKLWSGHEKKAFVRLMIRSGGIAGVGALLAWLGFFLFGTQILQLTVGAEYVGAYSVLVWYVLAVVVEVFAFPLQPAMLAMGHPQKTFVVHVATTLLYFGSLVGLLYLYELPGAGMAYLAYYLNWACIMCGLEYRMLTSRSAIPETLHKEATSEATT